MSMTMQDTVLESIAFIERNLQNEISVCDVAKAVSFSQFYFSREFSKHTHISVYDYILRRKVSESYKDLFNSKCKIVDLAYRYGFQSHEVYTRAFRKVFGENPSEAVIYKPLAIYEAIDDIYLDFLSGLKVEVVNKALEDLCFEVDSIATLDSGSSFLVLLSKENLFNYNCILKGSLKSDKTKFLSFYLNSLEHLIRIFHTDVRLSFRYFTDNFYNVDKMSSNFIIISKGSDYTDIAASNSLQQLVILR